MTVALFILFLVLLVGFFILTLIRQANNSQKTTKLNRRYELGVKSRSKAFFKKFETNKTRIKR